MNNPNQIFIGRIEAALTAVCFGLLGVFGKLGFASGFSVGELMSYRFLLSSLCLWIILGVFRPQWIKVSAKQIGVFALLGVFGYGSMSITYLEAIRGLNITTAVLLLYTYPFWVSLLSHFLTPYKITKKETVCLIMASVGLIFLLSGEVEFHKVSSVLAGLGSAFIYAFYIIFSGKIPQKVQPMASSMYVITFGAIALLSVYRPDISSVAHFSFTQMGVVVGIALISTVLPLTLELSSLQKIKPSDFSALMMLEPISAAIWGFLFFKENLQIGQLIGGVIILLALAMRFKNFSAK